MMVTHKMIADGMVAKYAALSIGRFNNTVKHALWPDPTLISNILGLSLNDTGDGGEVEFCIMGPVTSNTFSFEIGKPIYVGVGGYLTQRMPNKSVYRIGRAISTDTILVMPSEPYILNL